MQSGLVTATHGVIDGHTIVVTPTKGFHQGELVYAIATTGTLNVSGTQWQFNAGVIQPRCVGSFVQSSLLHRVSNSSAAWGDYDNDGDLDILLTGWDGSIEIALIYENKNGGFFVDSVASANLAGVAYGSAAWGDYDNDGDLDILLTGAAHPIREHGQRL
ncbi:MAG: VCBS repeat-containing protein [Anaerolineae bacterium]|nr:VCBS repeat-containing protein [Anaerolineae bacterium]